MLAQVRTTACSKNQHIAGGRVWVLIYVRMNISYHWTVCKGGCKKQPSFLPVSSSWDRQWSPHRTGLPPHVEIYNHWGNYHTDLENK